MRSTTGWILLALALYLGGALWALRVVLPAPASTLPHALGFLRNMDALVQGDQYFSVAKVTYDARLLIRAPQRLMEGQHCWPLRRAATVGEHMLGEGLLGVVPDVLFHEPILTYNVVLILLPCLAGLAMYALVLTFTASAPAALVAGLLFALHPVRLGNAAEPYWMGNHWTPLALLFAHRLFTRRRWSEACGLAIFTSLQVLDSFYPVLAFTLVGGVYGLSLLIHERREFRAIAPKLLVVALVVLTVALFVFVPYLRTRATWGTLLSGRFTFLYGPGELAFGGRLYPGTVMTVLAAVGVMDRFRGARCAPGHDPRLPFLAGGAFVLWAALAEVPVPILGLRVPSLFTLAKGIVPGLDAVRGGCQVSSGLYVVGALLAGFGVQALIEGRALARHLVTGFLVVAVLLEAFLPPLSRATFGRAVEFMPQLSRPPEAVLALYERAPDGALLDVPADVSVFSKADYVFRSAYHGHPVAACYGSFDSPLWADVAQLATRLPTDPDAAVALHALGIRTVVMHHGVRAAKRRSVILQPGPHLVTIGNAGLLTLYRLESTSEVAAGIGPIVAGAGELGPIEMPAGAPDLAVPFRNGTQVVYRHPEPLEPTALRAQWYDQAGTALAKYDVRGLLPLVLVPGETAVRQLAVPVPAIAGDYRLVVSLVAEPTSVLSNVAVHVRPPAARR